MDNRFMYFRTLSDFNQKKQNGEIPEISICFIEETGQIYTHGYFYLGQQQSGFNMEFIEGVSDEDGVIQSIQLPEPEPGYENVICSMLYYDTNHNQWSNVVTYKPTGTAQLITGGPKYGVSVVVGGVEAYRCPNAKYRIFYYKRKIQ